MENKQNIKDLIQKFYPHAKEKLGFDHPVRVIMRQDAENAQQSLGKTAYYDPAEKLIVLYVTDRHPKDVLRSFSHELVHHAQNCRGELNDLTTDGHYAKDGKGREIEEEAYLQGNLNLRDYEDSIKFKGVNEMKLTKSQLKSLIESTVNAIMIEGAKADKDYDGDGKIETSEEEYLGSRDKAIKKAINELEPITIRPEGDVELPEFVKQFIVRLDRELEIDTEQFEKFMKKMIVQRAIKRAEEIPDDVTGAGFDLKFEDIDEISPVPTPIPKRDEKEDVDEMHCGGKRDDELEEQRPEVGPEREPGQRGRDNPILSLANQLEAYIARLRVAAKEGNVKSVKSEIQNLRQTLSIFEKNMKNFDDGRMRFTRGSLEEQEVVTPRSAKEKREEEEKKKGFKKRNPEISKALDSVRLKDKDEKEFVEPADPAPNLEENNKTWYNSSLYESLKSKWTK